MEITVYLVDWESIEEKADQGTLSADLLDIEGDEDWIGKSKKWANESFADYCTISALFENKLSELDENTRSICARSISFLLNETAGMPKESGAALNPEYYVCAISPHTVNNILSEYNIIDYSALINVIPKEVVSYIDEWGSVLNEAVSSKRGILVNVG